MIDSRGSEPHETISDLGETTREAVEDDSDLRSLFSGEGSATPESETLRSSLRLRLFGALPEGARIGRYVVQRHIGSGGMGSVYLAHDSKLRRSVALKLLHPSTDVPRRLERRRRRLLREAHGLARLSHPNVVQVHDVDTHGEHLFLVMDYVEGCTLKEWIDAGPRSWQEILEVFRQAGAGLAAAHSAGMIHRDFKPSNVLISADGRALVIDFGLVRVDDLTTSSEEREAITEDANYADSADGRVLAADASGPGPNEDLTAPGAVLGTLAYIPPEIFGGAAADARSDVYSFCVSLYEALYGSRPFRADSRDLLICNIIDGRRQVTPPGKKIPRWLTQVCLRGLATDPAQRPASMAALLAELSPGRQLRRRLLPLAAGLVGAFMTAVAVAAAVSPGSPCAAEAAAPSFWGASDRAAVRGAVVSAGLRDPQAAWTSLDALLSARAAGLEASRAAVCDGAEAPQAAARTRCLATIAGDHRRAIDGLVAGDVVRMTALIDGAEAPLDPSHCDDPELLAALGDAAASVDDAADGEETIRASAAVQAIADELARAQALVDDGRYRDALAAASGAQRAAEAAGSVAQEAVGWHLRGYIEAILGDPASAESQAMAQTLAAQEGDEPLLLLSILERARAIASLRGAPAEAAPWVERAQRRLESRGLGPLDEAQFHLALAEVAAVSADYAGARRHLEVSRGLRERYLGDDHPLVAETINNLAAVADLQGDLRAALDLYRRALALREAALRPDHPVIAATLTGLAGVLARQGDDEGAEATYARALEIDRAAFGDAHPRVARILHNMGVAARHRGELERADDLYAEALEIRRRSLGAGHPEVADTLNAMAYIAKRRGDEEVAMRHYGEALAIRERQLGADHPRVASTLGSLANLHLHRGDEVEALPLLRRAQAIYEEQGTIGAIDLAWILRLRGRAELGAGRPEAAIPVLERAIALDRATVAADPSQADELTKAEALLDEARDSLSGAATGA
ncbi:MAG: serine/threonine-protein kinase [Nannocystaceae bacterium]